ncbi:MAG: (Fe-S)-binding protein [Thermodesulfobacteriota bacterium]|nr:(Fe-S)-binding protein [Thermodesulfobacteriota bacterium]
MAYIDNCDWRQCIECGQCLMQCPVLEMEKSDAVAAIRKLIAGVPVPGVFGQCTFCFNCNQYCPVNGLRPHELILQRALEHRGKVPGVLKYLANGRGTGNLFAALYKKLNQNEQSILNKWSELPDSREVLWVGCVGKLSCRDIEHSKVLAPLAKFGPPDLCCGELAYRIGSWEMYAATIERTLTVFENLEIDRMVCYCGSCYNFLSNILPKVYGKKLPFKLVSLYQWLWEQYEKGCLTVTAPRDFTAAIHESCYVTELEPDFADTLRKLYRIAGVETVELAHHGGCNLSCGAVSVVRNLNVMSSIFKEQRRKYREVSESGVTDIAVNCPGCFITLRFSNWLFGKRLRYMPDELLAAFGDDIAVPLQERVPQVAKTVAIRFPMLMFQ